MTLLPCPGSCQTCTSTSGTCSSRASVWRARHSGKSEFHHCRIKGMLLPIQTAFVVFWGDTLDFHTVTDITYWYFSIIDHLHALVRVGHDLLEPATVQVVFSEMGHVAGDVLLSTWMAAWIITYWFGKILWIRIWIHWVVPVHRMFRSTDVFMIIIIPLITSRFSL